MSELDITDAGVSVISYPGQLWIACWMVGSQEVAVIPINGEQVIGLIIYRKIAQALSDRMGEVAYVDVKVDIMLVLAAGVCDAAFGGGF